MQSSRRGGGGIINNDLSRSSGPPAELLRGPAPAGRRCGCPGAVSPRVRQPPEESPPSRPCPPADPSGGLEQRAPGRGRLSTARRGGGGPRRSPGLPGDGETGPAPARGRLRPVAPARPFSPHAAAGPSAGGAASPPPQESPRPSAEPPRLPQPAPTELPPAPQTPPPPLPAPRRRGPLQVPVVVSSPPPLPPPQAALQPGVAHGSL